MTTCCGLPWGAYKLVVSKLGKMDATLTNALTKASQEHNAEENAHVLKRSKEIVDNAALANATALRRLATAVYEDEMLLVADSVKSFHDAAQRRLQPQRAACYSQGRLERNNTLDRCGRRYSKEKDARKQVTIGCLLRATNLYVKYGRQRQLGDLDITLQTRAYVDERNLQWFPLFRFRVPADQLDEFHQENRRQIRPGTDDGQS